jgi:hypothetical protein
MSRRTLDTIAVPMPATLAQRSMTTTAIGRSTRLSKFITLAVAVLDSPITFAGSMHRAGAKPAGSNPARCCMGKLWQVAGWLVPILVSNMGWDRRSRFFPFFHAI